MTTLILYYLGDLILTMLVVNREADARTSDVPSTVTCSNIQTERDLILQRHPELTTTHRAIHCLSTSLYWVNSPPSNTLPSRLILFCLAIPILSSWPN